MSNSPLGASAAKLAELLAKARAAKIAATATLSNTVSTVTAVTAVTTDKYGNTISYNTKQQEFVNLAASGRSCILIGAAGTGKTTCMKGTVAGLIQSPRVGTLNSIDHSYLKSGTPGIVVVSFTRRAVNNIAKNMSEDMKANCLTIHALLEYSPVYYEVVVDNEIKNKMVFEATRTQQNPLDSSIKVCIIEEASMVSTQLFKELQDALPIDCQFIFLGDIQQLPPVFGAAILGYKMLELPIVELTEVYRQALESPIIKLAHRILSGVGIPEREFAEWKKPLQLTIHPWKKKLHAEAATGILAKFITQAIDLNVYNADEDMILIPFNKSCGTIEINKHVANHIAKKQSRTVYEIIGGFDKHYLSVGDKVLYDKADAVVTKIYENHKYSGAPPHPASVSLNYWGYDPEYVNNRQLVEGYSDDEMDFILSQTASIGDDERVRQASHVIVLRRLDTDTEVKIDSAGQLNLLLLSYALTVHKAQGSEWRKVFLFLHTSHATMLQRELLYTAVTRAKEELYVICEPESFVNGIRSQRIKGNTLAEKAEFFKGKLDSIENGKDRML